MPAAIQALQDAITLEVSHDERPDVDAEDGEARKGDAPGLRQRAMPFIDMLQRNHKAGTDVTWGV
jgi:hypothetical protein